MHCRKIFLAVTAALAAQAAPDALAQTANPVTLYGRAYAMFESVEAKGGATPVARRNRVSDRNSILGVRGTENLGGDLKAFFQFETLFIIDGTGATSYASRNSGIGVRGDWGAVLLGRWDTPFKMAHAARVDPFQDLSLADITGAAMNQGNFSRREQNVVQYWSPNWAGFEVKASYSANEGRTATANPSVYGASLVYAKGPFYAAYAYEKHEDQSGATVTAGVDEEGNAVSAFYRFGGFRLIGQYGEYKKTGTVKQKGWAAGFDWALGKHVILAIYQDSKDGGAAGAASQPKCDLVGLGYRYDFTKRTSFIAEYAQVTNDNGATCNFGTSPLSIAAGQDPRGFGAGIRHTF